MTREELEALRRQYDRAPQMGDCCTEKTGVIRRLIDEIERLSADRDKWLRECEFQRRAYDRLREGTP